MRFGSRSTQSASDLSRLHELVLKMVSDAETEAFDNGVHYERGNDAANRRATSASMEIRER